MKTLTNKGNCILCILDNSKLLPYDMAKQIAISIEGGIDIYQSIPLIIGDLFSYNHSNIYNDQYKYYSYIYNDNERALKETNISFIDDMLDIIYLIYDTEYSAELICRQHFEFPVEIQIYKHEKYAPVNKLFETAKKLLQISYYHGYDYTHEKTLTNWKFPVQQLLEYAIYYQE